MTRMMIGIRAALSLAGIACLSFAASPARGQAVERVSGKIDPDGLTREAVQRWAPEYFVSTQQRAETPMAASGDATIEALPDVDGPGSVLTVGNLVMKVTNWGHVGNLFQGIRSNDPSGQWPGASSVEYLSSIRLAVGAVNPNATDPTAVRRVSYLLEWRPATLDPEDRIYRAYDGIINGTRFVNDDNDRDLITQEPRIDEDFLDGRDNDGDGLIDEDHAALGQLLYSCVMRDDTPQAINSVFNEKHVPLGLECRQKAWAYSIAGFQDFDVVEYEIINRSGHTLDSLVIGWLIDMDSGPLSESTYFSDDFDMPKFPQGEFTVAVDGGGRYDVPDRPRRQFPHSPLLDGEFDEDSALCARVTLRINGFSIADDNADDGKTKGTPAFVLIDHSIDPLGISGPPRVGFRAFRSFTAGTPYTGGGNPIIDQQRYEFMTGVDNIDSETGFITSETGETKGDYVEWCSIGPWRNVPDGASLFATIAFIVKDGSFDLNKGYVEDYARYQAGSMSGAELMDKYPVLATAWAAQIAFEGIHERREGFPPTDFHGRESGRRVKRGEPPQFLADCRDEVVGTTRLVNDLDYTWFDFDCNYCTGVWDYSAGAGEPRAGGMFHKTWNAAAPPPNPNLNTSVSYNFTDNPSRSAAFTPAQDHAVLIAWDNQSETTPDPKSQYFDFRGYRIWKVSDWTRPVGSPGPSEADWNLLGEFRLFDYEVRNESGQFAPIPNNKYVDAQGDTVCPTVYIPNWKDPATGIRGPANVPICLERGDLWNRQSGEILRPDRAMRCVTVPGNPDSCEVTEGCILHRRPCNVASNRERRPKYPIGRYTYLDREVKNGFTYFYSVTAFDSVSESGGTTELGGRRSAVESEGVVPQVSTRRGKSVWVVPNPYRGYARITDRPSSWDLTPNASDPTGTHLDFMGLPPGKWTIKIFTVSGDLVTELHSDDAVNESLRAPVKDAAGNTYAGYNRQQDHANDGQARWNLISRNGQDVVSGIYVFVVESGEGTQRGKFVVIR